MHNASPVAAPFDMDVDIPSVKAEPDIEMKDDMGGSSTQAEHWP